MSGTTVQTLLVSPKQSHNIYAQTGAYPKQRHTFLVRFNMAGAAKSLMTYAVKSIDRPAIQPVVEEVNQYNKKQQIYTGYKRSPVKCTFYDDSAGSAQTMWAAYSKYYFGDFVVANAPSRFSDDLVSGTWNDDDSRSDFGFTAKNGVSGKSGPGSQWFFKSIDILHFHSKSYDLYSLLNPRLASFAPDELDYEQSAVGLINAEFVYEALIFTPNHSDGPQQPEFKDQFASGANNSWADQNPTATTALPQPTIQDASSLASGVEQMFGSVLGYGADSVGPDYRYYNAPASGGLGVFGNFVFGRNRSGGPSGQLNLGLSTLAGGNSGLAAVLGISVGGNPLAGGTSLGVIGGTGGYRGAPPQYPGVLASVDSAMSNTYGGFNQRIAQGVLASSFANGFTAGFVGGNGQVSLPPGAYSMINAQGSGTTQYGYNPTPDQGGAPPPSYGGPTQAPANAAIGVPLTQPTQANLDARIAAVAISVPPTPAVAYGARTNRLTDPINPVADADTGVSTQFT
jgi:hypothetical protein